jgi:DNA-directed RNA polymerase specialized sigma24 family protein
VADIDLAALEPQEDLLALDGSLNRLAANDRTAAEAVQLRYFAKLALPEAAESLGISARTAGRLCAWLRREILGSGSSIAPARITGYPLSHQRSTSTRRLTS